MTFDSIKPLLDQALASHRTVSGSRHEEAFRLFNGFYEGHPDLVLDIYGRTLVIHDYAEQPDSDFIREVAGHVKTALDWLRAGLVKTRNGATQSAKCGELLFGDLPDRKIKEHGVWYALDLTMNRDTSFYLDTSNLRKWLIENARGKTVLNTFAYTGSLGVAAAAGGAARVVQTDLNRRFLNLAKDSYSLNGFPIEKRDFIAQDFFPAAARLKSTKQFFDCVIIDPPFFSSTERGKVDLIHESARLINKVRPLINHGGWLIAINNALFLSGAEYMRTLEDLCRDGYLSIRELIPVPEEFIGVRRIEKPITDPAPFNHSTKIAILDVRRK
ncbi:MAG: SAM-dependent methyltransferase [Chloroflexi bacterium]|nr:SAM-dependent methyltransferase [Chloroflexota bacterium]MDL1941197.1 SAM-dependent methyltransferase [Chloroflexi bacterium CFX2]